MTAKSLQGFRRGLIALPSSLTGSSLEHARMCTSSLLQGQHLSRTMATETTLLTSTPPTSPSKSILPPVLTTIHKFPSMEPTGLESHPAHHLHLPLRRDLLHRAVIHEADATRQGTASTKTRWEIHGSRRKLRPQKGTGHARVGSAQSPIRRGGSKAHGPRPRDFATGLPRQMYDLAWRTALSYRYRRGELIVCEDGMEMERARPEDAERIFLHHGWGREQGRSLLITRAWRPNLFEAMAEIGRHGVARVVENVDVKNLLECGRLIVERSALREMLLQHQERASVEQ